MVITNTIVLSSSRLPVVTMSISHMESESATITWTLDGLKFNELAAPWEVAGTLAPSLFKFFHFHAVFGGNLAK